MPKKIIIVCALSLFLAGCSFSGLSKEQYFAKGKEYLNKGNANGAIIAFKKALEDDQNYFEARYQLALAYISTEKYDQAVKEIMKVLRLNPSLDEAHLSLARAYVHTERPDDAIREIKDYLNRHNQAPEAYEVLANAYKLKKDYRKAGEVIAKALEFAHERTSARIIQAEIYLDEGDTDRAEPVVHDLIVSDSGDKKALRLLARIERKRGNNNAVIETYQKILSIDPEDTIIRIELGLVYLTMHQIEKAEGIASELIKAHPDKPAGRYLLGLVYFQQKKMNDAITMLQEAVSKVYIPAAVYYLGLSHLAVGNIEQAINQFQKVIDHDPGFVQARLLLAAAYLSKRWPDQAVKQIKTAIETDERNALAHNLLGSAYLALGRHELAMEEFDRAIELNPGVVDAHLKKGAYSLASGKPDKAEEEFLTAVDLNPELLNSRIILARYYMKDRRFDDAVRVLEEGLRENPKDAILLNMMGGAYLGMKNTAAARESFEKAISSDQSFLPPFFNLAQMYSGMNQPEKALDAYQRILKVDQQNVPAMILSAKIMEADKRHDEATRLYEKAKGLKSVEAYFAYAEYSLRNRDVNKSISILEEAMNLFPGNIKVLDFLGRIYSSLKDPEKTLAVYGKMKQQNALIGGIRIARVYTESGRYEDALKELKGIPSDEKNSREIHEEMVNVYLKQKNYEAAESTARKIIESDQGKADSYRALASVYFAREQYHDTIEALQKAESLSPGNAEIKLAIGRAYMSAKDWKTAVQVFQEIERAAPQYMPVYILAATAYEKMGDMKSAVAQLKEALKLNLDHVPTLNNLAYLYAEGYGPIEEAVDMAIKAKKMAPRNGSVADTLGWAYFKQGDYDEALKYFQEAAGYLPKEPAIRYHLGLAYMKKGSKSLSEKEMENAIELGGKVGFSGYADAADILKEIRSVR